MGKSNDLKFNEFPNGFQGYFKDALEAYNEYSKLGKIESVDRRCGKLNWFNKNIPASFELDCN